MCDYKIAKQYINKTKNAHTAGHEFSLSFADFKKLKTRKLCGLSGIPLTEETNTVDRLDNSKGYIKGNVMAVHDMFNNLKATLENPQIPESNLKALTKFCKTLNKLGLAL